MPHEMPRLKITSKDRNDLTMYAASAHHASAANFVTRSIMKIPAANKKYNFLYMLSNYRTFSLQLNKNFIPYLFNFIRNKRLLFITNFHMERHCFLIFPFRFGEEIKKCYIFNALINFCNHLN